MTPEPLVLPGAVLGSVDDLDDLSRTIANEKRGGVPVYDDFLVRTV